MISLKIINGLGNAFKSRTLWIAAVILLILLLFKQCNDTKKLAFREQVAQGNIKAMQGQLGEWKTKNGQLVKQYGLLTGTVDDLKKLSADNYNKYLDMMGKNAKNQELVSYLNGQLSYSSEVIDSLRLTSANGKPPAGPFYISSDSSFTIIDSVRYDNLNYRITSGEFKFKIDSNKLKGGTGVLKNSFGLSLDIATTWDKKEKMTKVAITTPFKDIDVKVSGIAGLEARLNEKPKKSDILGIGFHLGYGIGGAKSSPAFGPQIGVGLYYIPSFLQLKINNKK
jgi:hypothetical protein